MVLVLAGPRIVFQGVWGVNGGLLIKGKVENIERCKPIRGGAEDPTDEGVYVFNVGGSFWVSVMWWGHRG